MDCERCSGKGCPQSIYPVDIIIIVLPPLYHRHTKGSVTGVVLKKLYDTPKSFYLNHHTRFVFNLYVSATLHDFASPGLESLCSPSPRDVTLIRATMPFRSFKWSHKRPSACVCGLMMSSGRKLCLWAWYQGNWIFIELICSFLKPYQHSIVLWRNERVRILIKSWNIHSKQHSVHLCT